jgi:hypothetical protein
MSLIDQIEALGYETDIEFLTIETATQLLLEFSHGELTAASAQDLILHWQTARDRLRKAGNDMSNEKCDPDEIQEEKDSIDRIERRRAGGS